MDPRLEKMAQIIAHYSLAVKKGENVWFTGDLGALPLFESLYKEMIQAGAHVFSTFSLERFDELFFKYANEEQLSYLSPFTQYLTEKCDKRVRLIGSENTRALSGVDPKKQAKTSKARHSLLKTTLERSAKGELGWIVSLCPTIGLAQEANMGFYEYQEFVFEAAFVNTPDPVAAWLEQEKKQAALIEYLSTVKELHFKTKEGTDLFVNVEGMQWINSCGKRNFPDGEVFTGPNLNAKDGGINGVVRYTYPAILGAQAVEDVTLTFEKGRVVDAKAAKNSAFLKAMIEQDEGASTFGEIAIGTNYRIQKFTQNILFDEKIGGTFHAALGAGYPETGNSNQSALHWDMICDLREGGEILGDGKVFSKNGCFINPAWPQPIGKK